MPRFITIGYGDQSGYDRTNEPVRNAAHEHDADLKRVGAIMGVAGAPAQVRNPDDAGSARPTAATNAQSGGPDAGS